MIQLCQKTILIIAMLVMAGHAKETFAQLQLTSTDFSFQFRANSPMRAQIISGRQDSTAILLVNLQAPLDSLRKFTVSYSLLTTPEDMITKKIALNPLATYFQHEDANGTLFAIKARVDRARYIVLWLRDSTKNITYPYLKKIARRNNVDDIILKSARSNTTIFNNFLPLGATVQTASLFQNQYSVTVDLYDYHFLPAKPPMVVKPDSVNVPFTVEKSVIKASTDSIALTEKGLYYFHWTNASIGRSVIVREKSYPKFTKIDRLVESIRYLTTKEEYEKMTTSFKKKELFDEFWLNNAKSPVKAKRVIRAYYKRVREANMLFTSYKEGWKTDMGMIYIIFGPPSKAIMKDEGVMWIYDKTFELPRVAFFFKHINTAFTDQHYVLVRKPEFQNLWYRTIDLWRSGKKEF